MTKLRPTRGLIAIGLAVGATLVLVAVAQAGRSTKAGTLVTARNTALGTILVDARGRTLYLFEKDRADASMCGPGCTTYWPKLTSRWLPRAGKGVRQSLLQLTVSRGGARQVTYAGHPLYTFVGDKRAGQTAGEGLADFGAQWYAVAPNGDKVDKDANTNVGSGSGSGMGYGGYGASTGGY